MGNNYSLKQEAKYIVNNSELDCFEAGYTAALMFCESGDDGDHSLLECNINIESFSEDSILNIQQRCSKIKQWLEQNQIQEQWEDDFDIEKLGYYFYMHENGHGVSIDDDEKTEFTMQFSEQALYNPVDVWVEQLDEDEVVVHVM